MPTLRALIFRTSMPEPSDTNRHRLTDSPWFWVMLFAGVALAALVVVGPKHLRRQQRLVRMQNARVDAAARSKAGNAQKPPESVAEPDVSILPLFIVLTLVLVAACAGLMFGRRTQRHHPGAGEDHPP